MNNMRQHLRGLSYIEVMIAMALISIVVIPMHNALTTILQSYEHAQTKSADLELVTNRLEELLAESYDQLYQAAVAAGSASIPSQYSDPQSTPNRRLVFVSLWDGDNTDNDNNGLTGGDTGLLWIRVQAEASGYSIDTLVVDE